MKTAIKISEPVGLAVTGAPASGAPSSDPLLDGAEAQRLFLRPTLASSLAITSAAGFACALGKTEAAGAKNKDDLADIDQFLTRHDDLKRVVLSTLGAAGAGIPIALGLGQAAAKIAAAQGAVEVAELASLEPGASAAAIPVSGPGAAPGAETATSELIHLAPTGFDDLQIEDAAPDWANFDAGAIGRELHHLDGLKADRWQAAQDAYLRKRGADGNDKDGQSWLRDLLDQRNAILGNGGSALGSLVAPLLLLTGTSVIGAFALNGTLSTGDAGDIVYTPAPGFEGADTIKYFVADLRDGSVVSAGSATVEVGAPPTVEPPPVEKVPEIVLADDHYGDGAIKDETGGASGGAGAALGGSDSAGDDGAEQGGQGPAPGGQALPAPLDPNRAPLVGSFTANATEEIALNRIDVLSGARDPEGGALQVSSATAAHGTVTLNPDGTLNYVPDADFFGTDTIVFTVVDGQGAASAGTVTVTVANVQDAPVAAASLASGVVEDTAANAIDVLSSAFDVDGDALTVVAAGAAHGSVAINVDGTLAYTPNADFFGADTIGYTISDGQGNFANGTVAVSVANVNDAPVPDAALAAALTEDTATNIIDVLGTAVDADGDALTVAAASALHGTVAINPDGTLAYTPDADYFGADTITYTVSDGHGGSATGTVSVSVANVNDAPVVAATLAAATAEEAAIPAIDVLSSATDADGNPLSVSAASAPNGTVSINPDGTLHYNPNADFFGTDTITYTVSDGQGGSATGTVTVTVTNINDAPVPAAGLTAATSEETALAAIDVLGGAVDADGDALTVVTAGALHGSVSINPDGTLNYVPDGDYFGADTITYTVSDGQGGTATGTVAVAVSNVNDAPVALASFAVSTAEDTAIAAINVLAGATDADGDTLAVSAASALHGTVTVNPDGTLRYVPDGDYNGPDTISYTISDGQGGTSSSTVAVTVSAVNDAPVPAAGLSATTAEETALAAIDVLAGATDADGNPVSVTGASALHGAVTVNPDGTLNYVPNGDYFGADTITYTISDGQGGTATGTVAITVTGVNDAPVAAGPLSRSTAEDTTIASINVLSGASDADGNPLSVSAASALHGTVTVNGNGTLRYVPTGNYNGADTITYTISDGQGGTATGTVDVTVTAVNDAPVPVSGMALTTGIHMPLSDIDVLSGATDADGDTLTVSTAWASQGAVTVNPDGTLNYSPNPSFTGVDTVTYTLSDGQGGTTTGTFTVTVSPSSDIILTGTAASEFFVTYGGNDTIKGKGGGDVIIAGGGNDKIYGSGGNNALFGGDGNDIVEDKKDGDSLLAGGRGTDSLKGGGGGDFFVFGGADIGTGVDTIEDFKISDGDAIVLADMLQGFVPGTSNIANFVRFVVSGGNTTVQVNADGAGGDWADVTVLEGVTGLNVTTLYNNGDLLVTRSPVTAGDIGVLMSSVDSPATNTVDIDVLSGASDPDGDPLSVFTAVAMHGTVTINPDGTLTYVKQGGLWQFDTISYLVTDGKGGSYWDTVTIFVGAEQMDATYLGTNSGQLLAGGAGQEVFLGLDGADTITGNGPNGSGNPTSANDTILGGAGADTLRGDGGGDTFVVRPYEMGTGVDTIQDFDLGEGDKLDLSDVLIGFTGGNISDWVQLVDTGSDVQVRVDPYGQGNYAFTAFVLEDSNVTLTDLVNNDAIIGLPTPAPGPVVPIGAPTVWTSDLFGAQDQYIPFQVGVTPAGAPGTQTVTVQVSGVPAQYSFNQGTFLGSGVWSFEENELSGLALLSPDGSTEAELNLTVTATAIDNATGATAASSTSMAINFSDVEFTISGNNGANNIVGTSGDDVIRGLGGNDTLNGASETDWLDGGDGDDTLDGESAKDILYGGLGADTLTGGSDSDIFAWRAGENDAVDTITDFEDGEGDKLDIAQLLIGFTPGISSFGDYVQLSQVGIDTHVSIDADGAANGSAFSLLAILTDVTAADLGTVPNAANGHFIM